MSLNVVILQGRLAKDVEFKQVNDVNVMINSVAVQRNYTNANKDYESDFFDIEVWCKSPAQVNYWKQQFHKGSRIEIEGELKTNKWQDKDGNNRTKVVIRVLNHHKIDFKTSEPTQEQEQAQRVATPQATQVPPVLLDDLPF